jgi:type II secretory pathway pseudopilin PulG
MGASMVEVIVVISIVLILSAIIFPAFSEAKKSSQTTTSISNMRQISLVMHLYRSDWDGDDLGLTPPQLGIPPTALGYPAWYYNAGHTGPEPPEFRTPSVRQLLASPCAAPFANIQPPVAHVPGQIQYATNWYSNSHLKPVLEGLPMFDYIKRYRQNSAVVFDVYCNDLGTDFSNPLSSKRLMAISIDHRLWNRQRAVAVEDITVLTDPINN